MPSPIVEVVKVKLPDDVARKFSHQWLEDHVVEVIAKEVKQFVDVEFKALRAAFLAWTTRSYSSIIERSGIDKDDALADVTASRAIKIITALIANHPTNRGTLPFPDRISFDTPALLYDYATAADLDVFYADKNETFAARQQEYLKTILIREYLRQRDVDVISTFNMTDNIVEFTVVPHNYDDLDPNSSRKVSRETFYIVCGPSSVLLSLSETEINMDQHIILLQIDTTVPSLMTDTGDVDDYISRAINRCVRTSGGYGSRQFWNTVTDDFNVAILRFSELLPLEPNADPHEPVVKHTNDGPSSRC